MGKSRRLLLCTSTWPMLMQKLLLLILSLLFLSECGHARAQSQGLIDEELHALLDLRKSLQDPMGHLSGWVEADKDNACLDWKGVQCSSFAPFMVEALDLSSLNLSGVLSADIGRFHGLVNMSVAVNNLSGPLPPQLWDIGPSLLFVNISNNLFQGPFSYLNLSNALSLQVLDAYNNNFTGPLPLQISFLSGLRHLHLGGNFFDGAIPPQYGALQNLTYLALSGNSLTGRIPVELGNLPLLQQLYLGYYNVFDGGIPSALGRLSELFILDMADCGLTGDIPAHLQNLTKLNSLFLQINSLTGPIPPGLGRLVNLQSLDLSNNLLSGLIPPQLSSLSSLKLLNLFRNKLHGHIPSFVGDLPSLEVLSLWENNLTGNVPLHLGSNRNLLIVDLSSNSLTGFIPPNLCNGGSLQRLVLFNNLFTGPIPESLGSCFNMVRIRLGNNQLSGALPAGLLAIPTLQMLEIPLNNITGSMPDLIPANSNLGWLDCSGNRISGAIPASISNLTSLQTLLLPNNALSGTLPSEIGSLKHLSKLDCSENSLVGQIPASMGQCEALTYIDLSDNELEDGIPSDIQFLSVLDYLNLSHNHLSGDIPLSLQNINTLTAADFSFNNLSGVIPDQGQFATFNSSFFIGNAHLCGAQLVACSSFEPAGQARHRVQGEPAPVYWLIVGIISSLTLALFVVGIFCNRSALWALIKRESLESPWKLTAFQNLDFTASHILSCLTDENVIGKGGSGTVYKCATPAGYVAVKSLPGAYSRAAADVGAGGFRDHGFSAEIQTLGKIRHRNIVRLLGCCSSKETNFLIYEYMPNGSLGELLHGTRSGTLDWSKRYKIAVEAACGLCYLHHDCTPLIVHRDVKSNNILLDSKYEAHVADFGLAKALDFRESMSSVAGSYGYIAPEYVYTLKVDEKSDIYSFGVVLLELVTGRRPFEPEYGEGVDIVAWVRRKVQSREGVMDVVDYKILKEDEMRSSSNSAIMGEVMQVLRVALHCLVELPMQRPTMREVVQMLTEVPKRKPSIVHMFGSNLLPLHMPSSSNTSSSSISPSRALSSSNGKASLGSTSPPDLISI